MELSESDSDAREDDSTLLSSSPTPAKRPRSASPAMPRGVAQPIDNGQSPLKRGRQVISSSNGAAAAIGDAVAVPVAPAMVVDDAVSSRGCDRCGCVGSAESGSPEARSRGDGFCGDSSACCFGHTGPVQLKGAYGNFRGVSLCVSCAVTHNCSHCVVDNFYFSSKIQNRSLSQRAIGGFSTVLQPARRHDHNL